MLTKPKKMICTTILALFAMAPYAVTNAQGGDELPDAADLLDRYIEVTGGADAYRARTSQIARGTFSMAAMGVVGALTVYQDGENFLTSIELPGLGNIDSGVTDGVAWENSALQGARIKTGVERSQALREASLTAQVDWRDWYSDVETVGMQTIAGEDAYQVVMTPEEGGPQTMFLSVDSGLALRTDIVAASPMGDIPLQVTMSDYMEFGGILSPTKITQSVAGQTIEISLESAEFNVDIPASQFELPASIQAIVQ